MKKFRDQKGKFAPIYSKNLSQKVYGIRLPTDVAEIVEELGNDKIEWIRSAICQATRKPRKHAIVPPEPDQKLSKKVYGVRLPMDVAEIAEELGDRKSEFFRAAVSSAVESLW